MTILDVAVYKEMSYKIGKKILWNIQPSIITGMKQSQQVLD